MRLASATALSVSALLVFCAGAGASRLVLPRQPYLGVACATANSIACDRVGVAVWLSKPATHLSVTVAGQPIAMHAATKTCTTRNTPRRIRCNTDFVGYLHPAGLLRGPRRINTQSGNHYWASSRAAWAPVTITAHYANGAAATVTVHPTLNPGWG
jgi:hypothetical protein